MQYQTVCYVSYLLRLCYEINDVEMTSSLAVTSPSQLFTEVNLGPIKINFFLVFFLEENALKASHKNQSAASLFSRSCPAPIV